MVGKIQVEDLPQEVLKKLGLEAPAEKGPKMVKPQVAAMGGVLQALKGLTNRQALWVLRTATIIVRGYSRDKNRNPATTVAGRRRKTVDIRQ